MLSKTERQILRKIADSHLITKLELRRFLETNGSSGKDLSSVVDTITNRLTENRYITAINPVGSTCYIITQKGNQFLKDMEI